MSRLIPKNTQSTVRSCQWDADARAEPYFLCIFFKSGKPLFRVPIRSMQWIRAFNCGPRWQLFHRQVRQRDRVLSPHQMLNFLGVLLEHNEVKMIEMQEVANFIRETPSQLPRFAACA